MLPPYIVTESDVDEAVGILDAALTSTAAAKETGD
jgi:hypothetical protein